MKIAILINQRKQGIFNLRNIKSLESQTQTSSINKITCESVVYFKSHFKYKLYPNNLRDLEQQTKDILSPKMFPKVI